MGKINVEALADAVMKELIEFKDMTEEEFEEIAKEVAREGAKKLRATSPRGSGKEKKVTTRMGGALLISEKEMGNFNSLSITRKSRDLHICWNTGISPIWADVSGQSCISNQ